MKMMFNGSPIGSHLQYVPIPHFSHLQEDDTAVADVHIRRINRSAHGTILSTFLLRIQDRIRIMAATPRD